MTATAAVPRPAPVAGRPARWRLLHVLVSAAVVSLPLLRPSGPGNSGLVDLALLAAMLAGTVRASALALPIRLPYALPVGLAMAAGAVAATVNGGQAGVVWRGTVALAQDLFVFAWAAAIATIGRDHRALDVLCRAWAYSATGWAALMIIGELAGVPWLSGITERDGVRASLTLGDPNLAASYFVCALLVMRAARRPRPAWARRLACAVVVTAVLLTLSNGGILAMLVATALGGLFALARRRGAMVALAAATVLAFGAVAVVSTADVTGWVDRTEQSSPWIRDSLGREAQSSGSRSTVAAETARLWLEAPNPFGIGPASTEAALRAGQAPYVKEAHDDYLAAVLERGALGGIALALLVAAVAVRARRISAADGVGPQHRAVVPRPELLAAAAVAIGLSGFIYEVLHFRHVWAVLGLIAALELSGRRR
ncbi:O-antigen ligase family protein [Dactylosporangium sp. NPDC000555]|uniref:O-antigen ligase family protein n=1 Tax=Dactylosporangium sp. NPDC000555 TaxID=3154260 RepID=UPI003333A068